MKQFWQTITKYPRIIIHRHSRPDGDAIGAQVGLMWLIKDNYPDKEVYIVGDPAGRYSFVADSAPMTIDDGLYEGACSVVLDTSAPNLISDDRWTKAAMTLRVDHHLFIAPIAQYEVVDTSFESASGLLAYMAMDSGLTISQQAASALFTGMVTDSGRFRYDSTSARTMMVASKLLETGFSTEDIYRSLYSKDIADEKLRASFVERIAFTQHNVGYLYNDAELIARLGADPFGISRGMVGTMADLIGVSVWVNFTEAEGKVLCELRSNQYSIVHIATAYGGGGHAKACGATVADKETAMRMLADLDAFVAEQSC